MLHDGKPKMKFASVRELCAISMFAALLSVCGMIAIPMPLGVPMTLQTLIIPCAALILGTRKGIISVMLYILLGAAGLPVFSGGTGGISIVLGPTGGFILSFPLLALAAGIGSRLGGKPRLYAGLAMGAVVNFICGAFFYAFVMSCNIRTAVMVCVLPFLPLEAIKIVLSGFLGIRIKRALSMLTFKF